MIKTFNIVQFNDNWDVFCAKHAGLCLICATNYKSFEQKRHLSHDVNKGKYQFVLC